jgi:hypothetical protein
MWIAVSVGRGTLRSGGDWYQQRIREQPGAGTNMKLGVKESVLSLGLFGGVLLALVSIDPRVRDQVQLLVTGGDGLSVSSRALDLADALLLAVRYQSIEHAPLVAFAAVSAVLVLFMVKT